jgi:phenol 2-monooxygenase (NADPH)
MPSLLLPQKGRYGLRDYEKVFSSDLKSGNDIFTMRAINRLCGCILVVPSVCRERSPTWRLRAKCGIF